MSQLEAPEKPKYKSALKKSFAGPQSTFSDYKAMEAQFQRENATPLNGEICGGANDNNNDPNGYNAQQERRDKRGIEIKKGAQYKITFKDQIRRIKSGEIYRENIDDLIENDEEDEEDETDQQCYSDQDESPAQRKEREQEEEEEEEEEEQQQQEEKKSTPDSQHYRHRTRWSKKGRREALEDVIYVESYKEYNAHNPDTNTCCCIL